DEPAATIVATDATAAELGGDTATFVVSRGPGASTAYDRPVTVTFSGTATYTDDYAITGSSIVGGGFNFINVQIPAGQASVTLTLVPTFNAAIEGEETATLTVEGTSASATIADEPAAGIAVALVGYYYQDEILRYHPTSGAAAG